MLHRVALGAVLRAEREAQSLTMREVASVGNLAISFLSGVERGLQEPSSETMEAVAKGLNKEVALLYYYAANYLQTNGAKYKPE
jgi:transcriptional regulator with XRE-family HTH domain